MAGTPDPYAAFRINLEQQRKRAKDLLHAVRSGAPAARERVERATGGRAAGAFKLTDAHFVIARELGFASWPELRTHVVAMHAARAAIEKPGTAPDAGLRTLHIRCGSDIEHELAAAGFCGEFLSLWDPFPVGPVISGPDWIERRARFHAAAGTGVVDLEFDAYLAELTDADRRLAVSAAEYERVVIWMEHDSHDQLSSIRCLAHYARTHAPRVLELISIDHFPGSHRFIGLGQLPPEAMRLLWQRRITAGPAQLELAAASWTALTSDDPRGLAALVSTDTPALPHLAPALHRHLRELPSRDTGLSLTQFLMLQTLAEGSYTIGELWRLYIDREPLPFLGDTMFLHIVNEMGRAAVPMLERKRVDARQPFRDQLAITDTGRAVLRGDTDWLSLDPPPRWVGGVQIRGGEAVWRWDDVRRSVWYG